MIPSVGRIVHYKLGQYDIQELQDRLSRVSHLNRPTEGEVYPMLITKIFTDSPTEESPVNGRVFLDGRHDHWVTSRKQGDGPGSWSEPPRVEQAAEPIPEPQPEPEPAPVEPEPAPAEETPAEEPGVEPEPEA